MRIGIDAMGGDRAPGEVVKGALAAIGLLAPDDRIVVIGDEEAIRDHLPAEAKWQGSLEIHHAPEAIGMAEAPVEALRAKPDSSIAIMATMQRHGQLDAGISAGNTGAFVAAAQMHLHRLRGVHRPGISIVTPTAHGPVAICDVGANVNCRPQHLHQYGVMASTYVNLVCRVKSPRIGLLSIGEEDAKGNDLVKEARALLRRDPSLNFIGNVEGRDLFRGVCDVMLCDGFVGNVVLKLMEGMAEGVVLSLLGELAALLPNGGSEILAKATGAIKSKYDFNEYGGAPLLGVGGICIICHGASDYRGVKNAVRVAMEFSRHQVNQQIIELLCRDQRALHG